MQQVNVNPLLIQISQLACNIRSHACKRRRTHISDFAIESNDGVIPSTSLDDAFTRRAWKQGAVPADTHSQNTGNGAYWASTLGPRSHVLSSSIKVDLVSSTT